MPFSLKPDQGLDVDIERIDYLQGHVDTGERWVLNFGPQHPATHTTLRLVLELDGERVVRCTPHIGYLHSGFEKLAEHLDYNQYVTIVSRMDYLSPICNDIAWHGAVEHLFDIDLTPRCKVLRTLMFEFGRIQNHLLCVGAAGLDLGAFTAFIYGFNARESIYDLCDYVSGQRFHPDWTRVGGLMQDLPDEQVFLKLCRRSVEDVKRTLDDMEGLLNRNRIFMDRTQGVGVITREEAVAWSLSGPCARASGVRRDVRKDFPYLCYADNWDGRGAPGVKFRVPVMTEGDCYARYRVRAEEIKQSLDIIEQLLAMGLPAGPIDTFSDAKMVKPPKSEVYGSIEGLIQHFELIMSNRGWKAPVGEAYWCCESPNGELGYYLVADGGPRAWRVKVRPPCFINYSAMAKMTEGHLVSDVVAVLGSINVVAAELDR